MEDEDEYERIINDAQNIQVEDDTDNDGTPFTE